MGKVGRILLVGAEPDKMPRLKLVYKSLKTLGYDVRVFAPFQRKGNSVMRYLANMVKLLFERADIYHLFNIPDVIGVPLLVKRGKLVYDVRSPWKEVVQDTTGKKYLAKIAEMLERVFCTKADVTIAVNPLLAERSISFGAKECDVVPNYPYEEMETDGWENLIVYQEPLVLYFGKISKVEGSEFLGDVIIETQKSAFPIRFIIAGDGPELPRLKQRIEEAGLTEDVDFLGWIPQSALFSYIKAADVCIMPREEFGTSKWIHPDSVWKVNEAVSLGTAVLASRVGGFTKDSEFPPLYTETNKDFVRGLTDLVMVIRAWGKFYPVDRDWRVCQRRLGLIYEMIK